MDSIALKHAIVTDPVLTTGLVLMLGLGQERDLGPVEGSGIAATLGKPVHVEDLRSSVRVALGLQCAAPIASEEPAAPPAPLTPAALPPTRGRLLLAEDNRINQKVAVAILAERRIPG